MLNPPPSASSVFLILSYIQSSNKNSSLYQFALVMFVLDYCTHRRTETITSLNQELSSRDFYWGKKYKVRTENSERVLVSSVGSSSEHQLACYSSEGFLWTIQQRRVLHEHKDNPYTLNANDQYCQQEKNPAPKHPPKKKNPFHFCTTFMPCQEEHVRIS